VSASPSSFFSSYLLTYLPKYLSFMVSPAPPFCGAVSKFARIDLIRQAHRSGKCRESSPLPSRENTPCALETQNVQQVETRTLCTCVGVKCKYVAYILHQICQAWEKIRHVLLCLCPNLSPETQPKRESNGHSDGTKRSGREKMGPVFVDQKLAGAEGEVERTSECWKIQHRVGEHQDREPTRPLLPRSLDALFSFSLFPLHSTEFSLLGGFACLLVCLFVCLFVCPLRDPTQSTRTGGRQQ
jgi:hypothetical protein